MNLIEALFYGLAISFPFGQFSQIPRVFGPFSEAKIYINDLLILTILISWFSWHLKTKKKIILASYGKWLFSFWGILFLSWLVNLKNYLFFDSLVGFLYLIRFIVYSSLGSVIYDLKSHGSRINTAFIFKCFWWWTIILSIFGLIQYLFLPDTRFLLSSGWDEHYFRVIGPLLDPNFMGIILVLGLLGVIGKIGGIRERREIWGRLIFLIFIGTVFLMTYSRSSYLALLFGLGVWFYLNKKLRYFFFLIFTFLFLILLLPRPGGEGVKLERTASVNQRLLSWQTAINIWQKYPLFGVGFNNYRYASHNLGYLTQDNWKENHAGAAPENSFLFVLATSGVLGILGLLVLLGKIFDEAKKIKEKKLKILLLSSFAAIFIHAQFINSLFYPWVMIWFGFLLGTLS